MSFLRRAASIVGTVAPFVAGPVAGTAIATVAGEVASQEAKKEAKKKQQQLAKEYNMADFSDFAAGSRGAVVVPPYRPPVATQNAGGGFFSDVGNFFRSAGGVVREAFGSGIPQLFGIGTPQGINQQPAITTQMSAGAQESQGSGSIQAGFGAGLAPLVNFGSRILRTPAGQIGLGTGIGGALSLTDMSGRQIRITRKTKRLAQQAYLSLIHI